VPHGVQRQPAKLIERQQWPWQQGRIVFDVDPGAVMASSLSDTASAASYSLNADSS